MSMTVAVPAGALVSPVWPTVSDPRKTISWKPVSGISESETGPAKSAVSKLVRVTVAKAGPLLVVKAALKIGLFPRIVESFPLGIDAAAAVAPGLDIVVRLRRSGGAAQVRLDSVIPTGHEPFIFERLDCR